MTHGITHPLVVGQGGGRVHQENVAAHGRVARNVRHDSLFVKAVIMVAIVVVGVGAIVARRSAGDTRVKWHPRLMVRAFRPRLGRRMGFEERKRSHARARCTSTYPAPQKSAIFSSCNQEKVIRPGSARRDTIHSRTRWGTSPTESIISRDNCRSQLLSWKSEPRRHAKPKTWA